MDLEFSGQPGHAKQITLVNGNKVAADGKTIVTATFNKPSSSICSDVTVASKVTAPHETLEDQPESPDEQPKFPNEHPREFLSVSSENRVTVLISSPTPVLQLDAPKPTVQWKNQQRDEVCRISVTPVVKVLKLINTGENIIIENRRQLEKIIFTGITPKFEFSLKNLTIDDNGRETHYRSVKRVTRDGPIAHEEIAIKSHISVTPANNSAIKTVYVLDLDMKISSDSPMTVKYTSGNINVKSDSTVIVNKPAINMTIDATEIVYRRPRIPTTLTVKRVKSVTLYRARHKVVIRGKTKVIHSPPRVD